MKQTILALSLLVTSLSSFSQTASFESFITQKDTFLNGVDVAPAEKLFKEGGLTFHCQYDLTNDYWASGFAVSSMTDSITGDYTNLYSAASGSGENGSLAYAIGQSGAVLNKGNVSLQIDSIAISNTAYAYWSMKNGDMFAKKFSSKAKDSFVLFIKGYEDTVLRHTQRVDLANFTFADSSKAFILKGWKNIKMESYEFGNANTFKFELVSSDNSSFGMNTPGFFAIDKIVLAFKTNIELAKETNFFTVFPNPSYKTIHIETKEINYKINIYDNTGKLVESAMNQQQINVESMRAGVYIVEMIAQNGIKSTEKLIKI